MTNKKDRAKSGEKIVNSVGVSAIKNGQKRRTSESAPRGDKPSWLKFVSPRGQGYQNVKKIVRSHKLSTVCEEAMCPNIGECWSAGTATIMLMGSVCTRACRFCAVDTGNPKGWLDYDEPHNTAESVALMALRYVVLTSVNRDDLSDGGAAHFSATVKAIKLRTPDTAVEGLTPDFQGVMHDVETLVDSGLEVFAQNIETVERLTHPVRDPRASYQQTLDVLAHGKKYRPDLITKTSLMLGLGETDDEIKRTMDDLREHNLDIVTFGQYLRPTVNHLPISRYVRPEEFQLYREWGLERGFLEVVSGPMVRSSYRAEQALLKNNAGISNRNLVSTIIPARQL
ncbi:lipoyl synthase [Litorivicinus sp.]|jgi:lipoic acid synthetase|nr:lipoyl synthase [Litorivicinus sp.]MDB9863292.1 lipoyl synthase [Litorivicinus sp.]MDC1319532.1 lipoyl synthase [Litorivicinus sp.]|tara:strand:- start:2701 stop:3723 length:1023 start_codon:yes stop_codon:yes gene_type:complete